MSPPANRKKSRRQNLDWSHAALFPVIPARHSGFFQQQQLVKALELAGIHKVPLPDHQPHSGAVWGTGTEQHHIGASADP